MIVLDAGVLIAHLDAADLHHERANELLVEADDELAASSITLAEVLVVPTRTARGDLVLAALGLLGVVELALPAGAAARLAQLRAETGLKLPDCCVLLAAEDAPATLATFDERLAAAATRRGLMTLS